MAFWSTADVEIASRIINAKTKNERRVRGKLTLHFAQAQTQSDADEAADRCAAIAENLLGEAHDHEHVIGAEQDLVAALRMRLPPSVPLIRSIDLAALHVVGDPGTSAALRRASTSSLRAVSLPTGMPTPPPSAGSTPPSAWNVPPSSGSKPPSSAPPGSNVRGQTVSSASPSGSFRAPSSGSP